MSKSRRTKACTFDKGTIARIISRDGDTCIFCASGRWPLAKKDFGAHIRDIAHVVNRSQGGLGVEQNGVTACRSHHQLLDNGNKHRTGKWSNAYIIGGYPFEAERNRLADMLGARLIHIDTSKEECLERLEYSEDGRDKKEWSKYIEDWWLQFEGGF